MVEVDIEQLNNKKTVWDTFVKQSFNGTIFHTTKWLNILDNYMDAKLEMLGCYKGEELISVFPLFIKEGRRMKHAFSPPSLTFTPYGGPLFKLSERQFKNESDWFSSIERVEEYLLEENVNHMMFTTTPLLNDIRMFLRSGYEVAPRFTYVLPLKKNKETIWQNLNRKTRTTIRKALSYKDISVESLPPDNEVLSVFWDMWGETHKRSNIKIPYIKELYCSLFSELYPKNLQIIVGKHDEDIGAMAILLLYEKKMHYWQAASDERFWKYKLPSIVMWEIIQRGLAGAYDVLEIVGANVPSTSKFKVGFNPSLQGYYQVEKFNRTSFKILDKFYTALKEKLYRVSA